MRVRFTTLALGLAVTGALTALTGCASSDNRSARTVTLVTHDSWAVSKPVLRAFTRETGWKVRVLQNGDAGAALNQVILTKDAPLGDVFFGVDNTFMSRALQQEIFTRFRASGLERIPRALRLDPTNRVTPIDYGDVCVNADKKYFAARNLALPRTLDDLAAPRYRDLLVVENPATSSPGLAFLSATVARYGEGWLDYWDRLRANGVLAVDGWEQAYNGEFSGAAGSTGTRPLVVSYASSPPAEVYFATPQPSNQPSSPPETAPTVSIDRTCFRQVEFAGVLRNAKHPNGARALINFMLSPRFQRDLPLSMFVFPAVTGTPLPPVFSRFTTVPAEPFTLPAARIGADRETWIGQWTARVLR